MHSVNTQRRYEKKTDNFPTELTINFQVLRAERHTYPAQPMASEQHVYQHGYNRYITVVTKLLPAFRFRCGPRTRFSPAGAGAGPQPWYRLMYRGHTSFDTESR